MSSSYCSSCKIELQNDDSIRAHYRSEFHHYNIKRKLVNLPPISPEQFTSKKAQLMAESSQSEKDQLVRCELCGKSFASKATYKQHLESKKHRENLKKFNDRGQLFDVEDEKKVSRSVKNTDEDQTVCLFCNLKSEDINENLVHMRLAHSFFISNFKNVKDVKGLLKYLGEKVHKKFVCINCGNGTNKENKSGEGIQRHMLDKGHTFMDNENFSEYGRFYDFTRYIEDLQKKNLLAGEGEEGSDILEVELEAVDEEDESENEDEDEENWEVIDENAMREKGKRRVIHVRGIKVLDSGEILLPSGNILGHRSYKNLYKQYYRTPARQNSSSVVSICSMDEHSLAVREEENRVAVFKDNQLRKERHIEKIMAHKFEMKRGKEQMALGVKANKLQKHFRRQEN